MRITCPECRRIITVPDERTDNPNLKVKCLCGAVFLFSEAALYVQPIARPEAVAPPPNAPSFASTLGEPPAAAPAPANQSPGVSPAAPRRAGSYVNWRRCSTHNQTRSIHVCENCKKGYCAECVENVHGAIVCRGCESMCLPADKYELRLELESRRGRSMWSELPTIIGYPLIDPLSYVILVIVVWIFSVAKEFAGSPMLIIIALAFSQGLMMAYAFTALTRVASGNLKSYMPEISEFSDLLTPLRLGLTAFVASMWPLLLSIGLMIYYLGSAPTRFVADGDLPMPVAHAQSTTAPAASPASASEDDEEGAEPASSPDGQMNHEARPYATSTRDPRRENYEVERIAPLSPALIVGLWALFGFGILWKLVYSPVALTVAALVRTAGFFSGILQTLNPVLGVATIYRMGSVYWQAAAIYTVVAVAQFVLGFSFSLIPFVGTLLRTFIDCYAWLVIGCTLGTAVFKRAHEVGLE